MTRLITEVKDVSQLAAATEILRRIEEHYAHAKAMKAQLEAELKADPTSARLAAELEFQRGAKGALSCTLQIIKDAIAGAK